LFVLAKIPTSQKWQLLPITAGTGIVETLQEWPRRTVGRAKVVVDYHF